MTGTAGYEKALDALSRTLALKCAVVTCDEERRPDGFCCETHHRTQPQYEQEAKDAVERLLEAAAAEMGVEGLDA